MAVRGLKSRADGHADARPRGRPPRPRPARPRETRLSTATLARREAWVGFARGDVPGRGRLRVAVLRRVLHHAAPRAHAFVRDAAGLDRSRSRCSRRSGFRRRPARPARPAGARRVCGASARSSRWHSLSHILLDWITSWGTMFLSPLVWTRFTLDWTFILDAVAVGSPRARPRRGPRRLEAVVLRARESPLARASSRRPRTSGSARSATRRPLASRGALGAARRAQRRDSAAGLAGPLAPSFGRRVRRDGRVRGSRQAGPGGRARRRTPRSSRARDSAAAS